MTTHFHKKKSSINKFRPDLRLWSIALLILFFAATLGAGAATTWKGPVNPPTDVSNLESPIDFSDLVSKSVLQKQTINGPIYVRNMANAWTDQYPARFGLDATFALTQIVSNFGKRFSMAIGTDGLPVIVYEGLLDYLEVIKCTNALCSAKVGPYRPGPSPLPHTNMYTSIAIGIDGYPIIAYHTQENYGVGNTGQLNLVHCVDIACENTVDVARELAHGGDVDFGRNPSIAIGSGGLPIISYWHKTGSSGGGLSVIHCKDIRCSDAYPWTIVDNSNNGGSPPSQYAGQEDMLALMPDSNGKAIIAYRGCKQGANYGNTNLCTVVVDCSGGQCTVAFGPTYQSGGMGSFITITTNPADGNRPILAYSASGVQVARCKDVNCSMFDPVPKTIDSSADKPSLAIGLDGLPVIAYYDSTAPDNMKVAHCNDVSCTTFDTATIDSNTESSNNADTRLAIGSDGFPVIVYRSEGGSDKVMIVHCADVACKNIGSRRIGALGIGNASSPGAFLPQFDTVSGNYGVMGYAAGGYGVYGYSAGGVAIGAKVNRDTDFAGYFSGPVKIEDSPDGPFGSVTSQYATSTKGMQTSSTTAAAVHLKAGPSVHPNGAYALRAQVPSGVAGGRNDVGALGQSDSNYGVLVTSQNKTITAYAYSASSYGVYGYSDDGTGVIGEADLARSKGQGVYGQGVDYGVYGKGVIPEAAPVTGAGIFACGTQEAGHFVGNVRVLGSLNMGVMTDITSGGVRTVTPLVSLTEAQLQAISTKAVSDGFTNATLTPLP